MSRLRREWEIFSNFSIKKRIEEMAQEPSWGKYGGDKEQLMPTMNEQQDVWDAIVDLKQFPERG